MSVERQIKSGLVMMLILSLAVGITEITPVNAGLSDVKSQEELKAIFGEHFMLAKEFNIKNQVVNKYEELELKRDLTAKEEKEKINAHIERALVLGNLNAKGFLSTGQLMKDIREGTRSFDIIFPETPVAGTAVDVTSNKQTEITQVCDCGSDNPAVHFLAGYVYYTWWGLWKHVVSDGNYGLLSNIVEIPTSTTLVKSSYSHPIYPFTDYSLSNGNNALFELDYQITDGDTLPSAIVFENDIRISDASDSWKTYWHTSVLGGQSEAGGAVTVTGFYPSHNHDF